MSYAGYYIKGEIISHIENKVEIQYENPIKFKCKIYEATTVPSSPLQGLTVHQTTFTVETQMKENIFKDYQKVRINGSVYSVENVRAILISQTSKLKIIKFEVQGV